jgi:hypothetical protein
MYYLTLFIKIKKLQLKLLKVHLRIHILIIQYRLNFKVKMKMVKKVKRTVLFLKKALNQVHMNHSN